MERWEAAIALAVLLAIYAGVDDANAEEPTANPPAAGMRVYIDPESGDFTAPPNEQSEPAPAAGGDALQRSRSTDDLVVEANPAGGYTVNLKRRFGGVVRATVADSGTEVECESADASGKD